MPVIEDECSVGSNFMELIIVIFATFFFLWMLGTMLGGGKAIADNIQWIIMVVVMIVVIMIIISSLSCFTWM
jgi:hypothetical protein